MPCTTVLVGRKASYDGSTMIARNDDGTISIFISETLESGYLYRFFVSDTNGKSSKYVTYGIAQ